MEKYIADVHERVGTAPEKFYKTTLFQSGALLLGLNCLETGQIQAVHRHAGQDKFYYVVEGTGKFTLGADCFDASSGAVIWAPADVDHGVENHGPDRLVLLVGIAPAPAARTSGNRS